jgi:hypothetical protein
VALSYTAIAEKRVRMAGGNDEKAPYLTADNEGNKAIM